MNKYFKYISLGLVAAAAASIAACSDDVALPQARIVVDTDSIFAPAIESTMAFNVDANCDWTLQFDGDGAQWARVSKAEAVGSAAIVLAIEGNTGSTARVTTATICNRTNTAVATLVIKQNPASADGTISVPELRALAANGTYTFGATDAKLRAIVMSNQQAGNFFENTLAVVSALEPGHGITVAHSGQLYVNAGEEIDIDLAGASVGRSTTTDQMQVTPAEGAAIVRTATSQIAPQPVAISASDLASGKYEGMFVSLDAQVSINDVNKSSLAGVLSMQTPDKEFFSMVVLPTSAMAADAVPTSSGTVAGLVVYYNGAFCLAPRSAADIALDAPRYDGGITFPYVLSFMTENANSKGRYINFIKDDANINNSYIMTKDGTGVTASLCLSSKGSNQLNFLFWADDSGHHNLQLGTFADGPDNNITYSFPLDEGLEDGFRIQMGWGSQKWGGMYWNVEYSVDGTNFHKIGTADQPTFALPKNMPYGSGKNYFMYSFDVKNPEVKPERRQTLYVRVRPFDLTGLNGGTISQTGSYARSCAHSCVVIDHVPSFKTAAPAGALWFQPFDALTDGSDYRLGDKLCGLLNFCGSDIADWTAAQSMGMSGTNVRQRPGYAQIGYVESEYTDHKSLANQAGALCTPAVGKAGNYVVSFDAMAYNNTSVFDKNGSSTSKDFGGDSRKAVVEVVNGGTINGATSFVIDNLDYTKFNSYSVTVEGATSLTYLRFTSPSDDKPYTRWFIDNICVKSK